MKTLSRALNESSSSIGKFKTIIKHLIEGINDCRKYADKEDIEIEDDLNESLDSILDVAQVVLKNPSSAYRALGGDSFSNLDEVIDDLTFDLDLFVKGNPNIDEDELAEKADFIIEYLGGLADGTFNRDDYEFD